MILITRVLAQFNIVQKLNEFLNDLTTTNVQLICLEIISCLGMTSSPREMYSVNNSSVLMDPSLPLFDYNSQLRTSNFFNPILQAYLSASGHNLDDMDRSEDDVEEGSETEDEEDPNSVSNVSISFDITNPHCSQTLNHTTATSLKEKISFNSLRILRLFFEVELERAIQLSQQEATLLQSLNGLEVANRNSKVSDLADIFLGLSPTK